MAKARERNKTEKAMAQSKARSLAARKLKKESKQFKGWTSVHGKSSAEKLILPNMTELCTACGANMFPWEKSKLKDSEKMYSLCCGYGAIKLPPFKDPSSELKKLFENTSQESRQFLLNIRRYNGLVAMASKCITGKLTDFTKVRSKGPSIYKMSGQMYHLIPNMFPVEGKKSKFSQIYVYDNECDETELNNRLEHVKKSERKFVKRETLKLIQSELKTNNPYVKVFSNAAKLFKRNPEKQLKMVIKAKGSIGAKKKKQKPSVQDVVVIAPGEQTEKRDVVLYRSQQDHPSKNDTVRIDENHFMYDPTAYPLILPFGDDGYSIDQTYDKKRLTALQFYRYHMQVRCTFNTLLKSRRLYQEWLCDMWSKIEGSRLKLIKNNQEQLRVEQYSGLQDALSNLKSSTTS